MEQTAQLISGFLDRELDDSGFATLSQTLREEPDAIDKLVVSSFVHAQLTQWMNIRQLRDELLADAFGEPTTVGCPTEARHHAKLQGSSMTAAHGGPLRELARVSSNWSRRQSIGVLAGLATVLLLATSVAVLTQLLIARPSIVAQLTEDTRCVWKADAAPLPVGTLLRANQTLELVSGRALITFGCGAQMVVEGPAKVQLTSTSAARLAGGRLGARVPTHAIGFLVATPAADFIDLGTEFTLSLEADNSCELQVFDGLVELRVLAGDRRTIAERLNISEGSAVRFDAQRKDVTSTNYDEEQRLVP